MDSEYIYAPCYSHLENSFYLCKNRYKDITDSKCVDYSIPADINIKDIKDQRLKLNMKENNHGKKIFIIYLEDSKLEYFKDRFMLIRDDSM